MNGPLPTYDVAIVGGGPAGAASAVVLARAGLEVLLVDRASFPRDKTCGDGITTWALRLLEELGLDPDAVPSFTPVERVHVSSPSGHAVTYPLPSGPDDGLFAAIARRVDLDAAVLDLARTAGVEVLDGHACTGARQLHDRVVVDVAGRGEIDASWLIGADGMWSPTRHHLGTAAPGYRGDWHAFRQYVTGVSPAASRDLFVWFEPDILPGYVWSFPVGDSAANVGFGIRRGGGWRVGAMAALWPELLARPTVRDVLGPHATPEGPHRAWPIPAHVGHAPLSAGRALWVGDAAAATDPMTGEGIGQALATGIWAAEAILGGGDPAFVRSRYGRRIQRDLVPDHRMAELLVRALQHRKGARAAVWVAGLAPWTRRNFARWLFEDYPRGVLLTPRRWRRGLLQGAGAYAGAAEHRSLDRSVNAVLG